MYLGFGKKKREREEIGGKRYGAFPSLFLSLSLSCPRNEQRFARNAPQQKTTRRDIMFAAQSTSFTGAKVVAAKSAKTTTRRYVFFYLEWFSARESHGCFSFVYIFAL